MAICNNSIIDVSQERGTIYLGVWDTLNVKEQQFDVSAWMNAFGDEGELLLLVQRNGDELPYSADNITLFGNILTWTFSETDTAKVGEGAAALVYIIDGETIARTTPYPTYVAPTLGMSGSEPPDPWQSWYTQIIEASAAAVRAAENAASSESNAADSARRAALAENQALNARNEARAAQTAAQTAQGKAEDAQTAAETAQGKAEDAQIAAEDAQTAAETAKGKAEDAQTAAETAQGKAEDAQTAAESAASSISAEAAILADWQAHRYDPFATETPTHAALIRTDLGAGAIPAKTFNLVASAGSGTVTIRHNGVNLFRLLGYSTTPTISVLGTNRSGYRVALPPGYYYFRLNLTPSSSTYFNMGVFDAAGNDVTYTSGDGGRLMYNNGTVPDLLRSDGGVLLTNVSGIPSGREIVRFRLGEGDTFCVFSRGSVSTGVSQWQYVTALQIEAATDAVAPFDSLVKPFATYQLLSPDASVVVDGAGTYTITPTPATALGENTFYIVPGSVVTATLDATLRLDPTLVYNSLKGA